MNLAADQRSTRLPDLSLPQPTNTADMDAHRAPLWVEGCQQCSHSLLAVLEPITLSIQSANSFFCEFTGLSASENQGHEQTSFLHLLDGSDQQAIAHLCNRHILYRVLQHLYPGQIERWRILDEPLMVSMQSLVHHEPRYVQVWIRSNALTLEGLIDGQDQIEALGINPSSSEDFRIWLNDAERLRVLEEAVQDISYRLSGRLLLEGVDITAQETIRRITQLLVDQNSVLQADKFERINEQMCRLFRADKTAIVCFQGQTARLFTGSVSADLDVAEYSFEELQGGYMMQAIASKSVVAVSDLAQNAVTELAQRLLKLGVRSLLLLPLMADPLVSGYPVCHPIGLVGVLSTEPHHFDSVDCRRADHLVPVFTAALVTALRQLHHKRFLNSIHPSVEWRFVQEAERRSLGLPADPIIFRDVFPLYGISDIRGSSRERNASVQADLLEQVNLGLAVVEAVCKAGAGAFSEQLRLDLCDMKTRLQESITVDAEVTVTDYLRDRLETHFPSFVQYSSEAQAAIAAYHNACEPRQGNVVYRARARYDFVLGQITSRLRDTWEQWQGRMQSIVPHYCDVEVTDGIDHMVYAGGAIAPQFSPFHLRSLRYEQLRAVCACARTAFDIQQEFESDLEVTHLVLVQDLTVDIFHDEDTERLFDVRGTRDTRYEIVKKRIDKAVDQSDQTRITQPGMLTVVYSTESEEQEYRQYLRYLTREGWTDGSIDTGDVEPLQGVTGLKFMRVNVLPAV